MIVGRHARKKISIVPITTITVKPSVISTSLTEMRMNSASSEMTSTRTLSKRWLTLSTALRIASEISIVLELACLTTPMPITDLPSSRTKLFASAGAKSTSATSPSRVLPLMIRSRISCGSVALASARTTSSCAFERNDPTGTS